MLKPRSWHEQPTNTGPALVQSSMQACHSAGPKICIGNFLPRSTMLSSNNKQMIQTNWGGGQRQWMKSLNYSLLKRTLSVVFFFFFLLFLTSKSKLNEIKHFVTGAWKMCFHELTRIICNSYHCLYVNGVSKWLKHFILIV